ncbi:MAG: J domain-containing protein [Actinomycetota bacterium]
MQNEAFETLGIQPTADGRAIRAAFVRLARIYHPDRFVDQPEEVRLEAERRMKDAAAAYEFLRNSSRSASTPARTPSIDDKELEARALEYREAAEARERQDERNRARWSRWAAIEQDARRRAEAEAEIAAMIKLKNEQGAPSGSFRTAGSTAPTKPGTIPASPAYPLPAAEQPAETTSYTLGDRIKAAKGIRATGLTPRVAAAE